MLFNSLEFLLFLPTVFCLYWFFFQKNLRAQNLLLLISSYVFYGWWDWRFLSLIFLSTIVDYFVGIKIYDSSDKKTKKSYLWISILFNLGLLGFFKYFNFFIDSWIDFLGAFGYEHQSTWTLKVILPVGISFYTFQTMSYALDIFYGKLKPTKDFISFASFVSFFPQLVAGPVERASRLLPQFTKKRKFNYKKATDGFRQIIWGFFKKIVIADNCAPHVDDIFSNYIEYLGVQLIFGAFFFAIQIYCDFSGYSDIAIGTAKLFGFELMSNFKFPYFSRDLGEFWRRWHISISSWFRDYIFIPLGGSFGKKIITIRNIFITFILSGLWHGADWKFVFWGILNAVYLLPSIIRNRSGSINFEQRLLPKIKESYQIIITFSLTMIAWVFFRADNITHGFSYLEHTFITNFYKDPKQILLLTTYVYKYRTIVLLISIFLMIEWFQRFKKHGLDIAHLPFPIRIIFYNGLFLVMDLYGVFNNYEFIYFKF
tara:strand:- start:2104 stop:3558 length:1455 start_codon:yes stop_codon:yes gene_type:complete